MLYIPTLLYPDRKILYDYLFAMFPQHVDERCFFCAPDSRIETLPTHTHVIFFSDMQSVWGTAEPQKEWMLCPHEEQGTIDTSAYRVTEELIASRFKHFHIIRLGSLFGTMVKDNAIQTYPYAYYLDDLWLDLQAILTADVPVINLAYGCTTRYTWLLPQLSTSSYLQDCLDKNAKIKSVLMSSRCVIADTFFYVTELDQAISFLSACQNIKLELSGIAKYFNYKHTANWNMYDIKALKSRYDSKNISIFSLSDTLCGSHVNMHTERDAYLQHFQRMAMFANILDAKKYVFNDRDARHIGDVGAYSDLSEAYTKAHKNFIRLTTVCVQLLNSIDNEIQPLLHPTESANYLFENDQVVAMTDVLSQTINIGMSSDLEKITDTSRLELVYVHTDSIGKSSVQLPSAIPFCIKIDRANYKDLASALLAFLRVTLELAGQL